MWYSSLAWVNLQRPGSGNNWFESNKFMVDKKIKIKLVTTWITYDAMH